MATKKSVEERGLVTLRSYLPHLAFAALGILLVFAGISMIEDEIKSLMLLNHGKGNKDMGYGMIIFGSMIVGGVLAQVALIRRRGNRGNA